MLNEFIAEFLGTAVLLIFGLNGSAGSVLSGNGVGGILIPALSFGVGTIISIYLSAPISGGHLNPAVTIGFAATGQLSWRKVPLYLAGQLLGALLGAMLVYLIYFQSLKGGNVILLEVVVGIFVPVGRYSWSAGNLLSAFLNEAVATGLLLLAVLVITDQVFTSSTLAVQALTLGLVISGLIVAFFYPTGAILNPVRDLGPRLMLTMFGYHRFTFFGNHLRFCLVAAIAGPIVGSLVACFAYCWFARQRAKHCEEDGRVIPLVLTVK